MSGRVFESRIRDVLVTFMLLSGAADLTRQFGRACLFSRIAGQYEEIRAQAKIRGLPGSESLEPQSSLVVTPLQAKGLERNTESLVKIIRQAMQEDGADTANIGTQQGRQDWLRYSLLQAVTMNSRAMAMAPSDPDAAMP